MAGDRFYSSPEWKILRATVLKRDHHRCVVPGCHTPKSHVTVDHIVSRRNGGSNDLSNLRSLCRNHDLKIKEGPDGIRHSGGALRALGCDLAGNPRDKNHPWFRVKEIQ